MNQKFKNNDIVYVNSDAFTAEKCKVVEFVKKEDNLSFYKIYSKKFNVLFGAPEDIIFSTKEEAIANFVEKTDRIQEYKKQIKNIKDLLNFPLSYCLCGEHKNTEAQQAYKERLTELIGK